MNKTTDTGIKMAARFAGTCGCCGESITAGSPIVFFAGRAADKYSRAAWHLGCSREYHAESGQDETGRPLRTAVAA
jgi:hypothetical protein